MYSEGAAVRSGYEGGIFDPPPDFANVAEAVNSYEETVSCWNDSLGVCPQEQAD